LSEFVSTMTAREVASHAAEAIGALLLLASDGGELTDPREAAAVIADLERLGTSLPQLCEQLARFLVARHEDGQIAGEDIDLTVPAAAEALSAASQAADMMTAALAEARVASSGLQRVWLRRQRWDIDSAIGPAVGHRWPRCAPALCNARDGWDSCDSRAPSKPARMSRKRLIGSQTNLSGHTMTSWSASQSRRPRARPPQ
jgi:hypothetical protein